MESSRGTLQQERVGQDKADDEHESNLELVWWMTQWESKAGKKKKKNQRGNKVKGRENDWGGGRWGCTAAKKFRKKKDYLETLEKPVWKDGDRDMRKNIKGSKVDLRERGQKDQGNFGGVESQKSREAGN